MRKFCKIKRDYQQNSREIKLDTIDKIRKSLIYKFFQYVKSHIRAESDKLEKCFNTKISS